MELRFLNEFIHLNESLASAKKRFLATELIDEDTFHKLTSIDQTSTKKYIEKICVFFQEQRTSKSTITLLQSLQTSIQIYDDLVSKNLVNQKDINKFKTFSEFSEFVETNKDLRSKTQSKRAIKDKEAELILDTPELFIVSPLTHEASKIYGSGTKWCITMQDSKYWEKYQKDGYKFYFVTNKNLPTNHPEYKIAVGVEEFNASIICYNAPDSAINFSKMVALYKLPRELFKPAPLTPEKWLARCTTGRYRLNKSTGLYDVEGDVLLQKKKLTELPLKFGKVSGNFNCSSNQLKSLEGCPHTVNGSFLCLDNRLSSLEGAPKEVHGNFWCSHNVERFKEDYVRSICNVHGKII